MPPSKLRLGLHEVTAQGEWRESAYQPMRAEHQSKMISTYPQRMYLLRKCSVRFNRHAESNMSQSSRPLRHKRRRHTPARRATARALAEVQRRDMHRSQCSPSQPLRFSHSDFVRSSRGSIGLSVGVSMSSSNDCFARPREASRPPKLEYGPPATGHDQVKCQQKLPNEAS